jgi:hypothetical protein
MVISQKALLHEEERAFVPTKCAQSDNSDNSIDEIIPRNINLG